jgi:ribonuclease HI
LLPRSGTFKLEPPARDVIKINVDGAFNLRTGAAAVGVIIRDHEGNPHVMVWCLLFQTQDVEEVEALAVLEGLSFVGRWPIESPVEIEKDLIVKPDSFYR